MLFGCVVLVEMGLYLYPELTQLVGARIEQYCFLKLGQFFLLTVLARSGQAMNTTLVGSLIGFGCLSLVLIGALIYMINRSRRTRYDPAKIVHNNEKLSMQNVGYIST